MNRALVAFLVTLNLSIVIYVFHYTRMVNEVRQDIQAEKEDTHRSEFLQSRPDTKAEKKDAHRAEKHPFRPLGKGEVLEDLEEQDAEGEDESTTMDPVIISSTTSTPKPNPAPLVMDEPIPRGMHVRINMQTGEREGRFLADEVADSNDADETSIVLSSTNDTNTDPSSLTYQTVDDDGQKVKKKFRTYEELKKEMADLNLNVKTDAEILTQHMRRFFDLSSQHLTRENVDEIMVILKDFENLLHQVDNGEEFAKQNGMFLIVAPLLKANVTKFRSLGANILGAAVQNNPKAQISALRAGVIPLLLHNIASHDDLEMRSSSLFALSCLVRSFPLAETKLIEEGGLPVLMDLFDDESKDSVKLQLKVVTFLSDLVIEKEDAKITMEEKERTIANVTDEIPREEFAQMIEKFRQYSTIDLKSMLFELGWCKKLSTLLTKRSFKTNPDRSIDSSWLNLNETDVDHDIVDKVVSATLPVAKQCQNVMITDKTIANSLSRLLKYYKKLSDSETDTDDTFYHDIYNKINQLGIELNLS